VSFECFYRIGPDRHNTAAAAVKYPFQSISRAEVELASYCSRHNGLSSGSNGALHSAPVKVKYRRRTGVIQCAHSTHAEQLPKRRLFWYQAASFRRICRLHQQIHLYFKENTMDIKVLGTGCANCKATIAVIDNIEQWLAA